MESLILTVCSPEANLQKVIGNQIYPLDRNFRNTKSILDFANMTFEDAFISANELASCKEVGDKPTLLISNGDINKHKEAIKSILRQFHADEHNIGILTPLANTPWGGGECLTARYYYDLLKDEFDCSFFDSGESRLTSMKNIHITPFKSAKGLEFDTVIIPSFNFFDFNFNVISWRDFFVGVTRAKNNLYLLSENDIPLIKNVVDSQTI